MGLTSWDQIGDNYNYSQLAGNWQIIDYHDHSPGRGVPLPVGALAAGAVTSPAIAAGTIGPQHLTSNLVQDLGLGGTGRGAISTAIAQTTNASETWLATPDQVSNIVLDTNGLILVDFQALWKVTANTGYAYITLNGTNVVSSGANNTFPVASTTTTSTHLSPLFTNGSGLATVTSTTTDSSEVLTGQIVGQGRVGIFAIAGTYSVGIQFGNVGGTGITQVQNRHLYVTSINFV